MASGTCCPGSLPSCTSSWPDDGPPDTPPLRHAPTDSPVGRSVSFGRSFAGAVHAVLCRDGGCRPSEGRRFVANQRVPVRRPARLTGYVEAHGDQAAAALLDRYRRSSGATVAEFGGAEIKTEGDSFYVVFPSASSAVQCGLAIVRAAADDAREAEGAPIQVGIGVHAGETVETAEGYRRARRSTSRRACAARREPGEVLGHRHRPRADADIPPVRFVDRGARRLKGIAEPVVLYRVEPLGAGHHHGTDARQRRGRVRRRVDAGAGRTAGRRCCSSDCWSAGRPSAGRVRRRAVSAPAASPSPPRKRHHADRGERPPRRRSRPPTRPSSSRRCPRSSASRASAPRRRANGWATVASRPLRPAAGGRGGDRLVRPLRQSLQQVSNELFGRSSTRESLPNAECARDVLARPGQLAGRQHAQRPAAVLLERTAACGSCGATTQSASWPGPCGRRHARGLAGPVRLVEPGAAVPALIARRRLRQSPRNTSFSSSQNHWRDVRFELAVGERQPRIERLVRARRPAEQHRVASSASTSLELAVDACALALVVGRHAAIQQLVDAVDPRSP